MHDDSGGPDTARTATDGGRGAPRPDRSGGGTGLDANVAAALSYVLVFVSGIVFYALEDDEFVRFHAAQSIAVFGGLVIANLLAVFVATIGFVGIGSLLSALVPLLGIALWAFLIVTAYQGRWTRVPVAANLADSLTARVEGGSPSSRSRSSSTGYGDDDAGRSDHSEAVETLRERYAEGKIGDDEFERKLERLLEREEGERADQDEFERSERSR